MKDPTTIENKGQDWEQDGPQQTATLQTERGLITETQETAKPKKKDKNPKDPEAAKKEEEKMEQIIDKELGEHVVDEEATERAAQANKSLLKPPDHKEVRLLDAAEALHAQRLPDDQARRRRAGHGLLRYLQSGHRLAVLLLH